MKYSSLALILSGLVCNAVSGSEMKEYCFAELGSSEAAWPLSKVQALIDAQKIQAVEKCMARIKAEQKKAEVFSRFDSSVSDQEFRARVKLFESASVSPNDSAMNGTDKYDVIDSSSDKASKIYVDYVDGFTVIKGEDE